MSRAFDWIFRDRNTRRIVIAQLPNAALLLFLAARAIERFGHPHGRVGTIVSGVAVTALLWWAIDEAGRGVNPFRRILGVVVGAIAVVAVIR